MTTTSKRKFDKIVTTEKINAAAYLDKDNIATLTIDGAEYVKEMKKEVYLINLLVSIHAIIIKINEYDPLFIIFWFNNTLLNVINAINAGLIPFLPSTPIYINTASIE